MKKLNKFIALSTAAAIGLSATPAAAQSAEETITVSLDVTIDIPDPVISGLEDVSLSWTEIPTSAGSVSDLQTFCVFTPTQFFSMTATGANSNGGSFVVEDSAQTDPDLQQIIYSVVMRDAFSGANTSLGGFGNGLQVTGIDSDLFNTDATCSDGENVSLEISITGSSRPGGSPNTNTSILEQIADGLTHNYSDQLTLLVEPEI
jgi:hypothetical protein